MNFMIKFWKASACLREIPLLTIPVIPLITKSIIKMVVEEWLQLLREVHRKDPGRTVAVHCVAGLGRAPVLVAIALIELGMRYEDAVELIRQKRRGAINAKQLAYLEKYRPKSRLRLKNGHRGNAVDWGLLTSSAFH
ncbi:Protein tyrosine phosphatase type IVA 3 [Armadillidium vulgare]|nr:Protein tyrosine phosphatase type IVA 3 [Armadillidium vulgare]